MNILDSPEEIKKLDSSNMIGSIQNLGKQLEVSYQEAKTVSLPSEYKNVKNIVISGMGGSGLGPHFIRSVFDISLPLQIVNDYKLPSFVDEESLVIVSSYSGNTEETLSTLTDGVEKGAKVVGIASGGKLIEELKQRNLSFYQFDPNYNPCGQPRMGLGYSIGGILGLLNQMGVVSLSDSDFTNTLAAIDKSSDFFSIEKALSANPAKELAEKLRGRIPIILAGSFLAGNAHIFANQINENGKTLSAYFLLPEANHHLLEGIKYPESLGKTVKVIFLETGLYDKKIQSRISVTKDVLKNTDIEAVSYKIQSSDKVSAAFETLVFSSWASFYLAILEGNDPTPIPNIDYFKVELAKFA